MSKKPQMKKYFTAMMTTTLLAVPTLQAFADDSSKIFVRTADGKS